MKRSYKARERARREQEILNAANRLMTEHGYAGVTMDHIAEAVGISKPTLYRHFASKDAMVARTIAEGMRHLAEFIPTTSGTAVDRLEQILRHMLRARIVRDTPASFAFSISREQAVPLLRAHHQVDESMNQVEQMFLELIEEGHRTGEIAADMPSGIVIGTMLALLGLIDGAPLMEGEPALNALIDPVVTFFRRGIAPPC
jgi:AcrR family transcriptional regulator